MTYSFDGYNYLIRLNRGERLGESIEQFCHETEVEGAWLSGLGAATDITLGFFNLKKDNKWRTFGQMMEAASLTGNLARDDQGKVMFRLHGILADGEYQTVRGHVKYLVAGATRI